MVYCVVYNCAKKHTSNTNDYTRHVSVVKFRPETTIAPPTPNLKIMAKRHTDGGTSLYRLVYATYSHMGEPLHPPGSRVQTNTTLF